MNKGLLCRRIEKLETLLPSVARATGWGSLAGVRAKLLNIAENQGPSGLAALRTELDHLGPTGLLRETIRYHLATTVSFKVPMRAWQKPQREHSG
jgi:hypothetical protein